MNTREIIERAKNGTIDNYILIEVTTDPHRPEIKQGVSVYIGDSWVPNPNITHQDFVQKYCKRGKITNLMTYPNGHPLYGPTGWQYATMATIETDNGIEYIYTDHLSLA